MSYNFVLKINSKVPEWWVQDKPKHIGEWWDRLEWQDYETPINYWNDPCPEYNSLIDGAWCYTESYNYTLYDVMGLDWLYKMLGNMGKEIDQGIINEIYNIGELIVNSIILLF